MRAPALLIVLACATAHAGHAPLDAAAARPDALVDLASPEGAALVGADWRYRDAALVALGPALDVGPHAEGKDFDDSGWERVAPAALTGRRGPGHVSFGWYRTRITIPARVGGLDTAGATAVFEIVVDDYAEVWVDGKLPLVLGQSGGPVVAGFNAPNRVVVARDLRPGQTLQLAVFAMNGPISVSPANKIWVRSATLDLYKPAPPPAESFGTVERLDPALDAIVPRRGAPRSSPTASGSPRARSGTPTATSCSRTRTPTPSTARPPKARSRSSAPRGATPAPTWRATTSRARKA